MRRMRWMSLRRGMSASGGTDQVVDDGIARVDGAPPRGGGELLRRPDQGGHVDRANEPGIDNNLGGDTQSLQDALSQGSDGDPFAARHIVGLAGGAMRRKPA